MATGESSKQARSSQASGSLGSPISFRTRRGSVASTSANSTIDKEQLAFALDRIHTAASRADSLTTFNDFAPPPIPTSGSESKGTAGDIVQQGFSGLYSRFREAVGVGNSSKRNQDVEGAEFDGPSRSSRLSVSSTSRTDTLASVSTVSSTQQASTVDKVSPGATSGHSDSRTQVPSSSKANSINLMTGAKSQSSSRQSLPTNATSSVVADPPVLSRDETSRSRLSAQETAEGSARRSLSRVDLEARLAATDSLTYDAREGKLPPRANRDDASSVTSGDTATSLPKGPAPPTIQTHHLRTPSGGSLMLSPDNARRRPTAIDRINRSRSPGSRGSSTDRGTAAASTISTSAHNSIYHESFSRDSHSHHMRSGSLRIPGTTMTHEGATARITELDRMRRQVLSKEFWMADDTVKECFLCQTPFSAFRRKHHCRTCGCIFDSKCTTVISGEKFGVQGSLRVCKRCLEVISRHLDGSASEDSGDEHSFMPRFFGGHSKSPSAASRSKLREQDLVLGSEGLEDARPVSTPMMAIPATRRVRDSNNRTSAILEIEGPQLSRPGSSRSLKSLASGRPHSSAGPGHRRHHSKHLLGRFKGAPEDRVPFRKGIDEESAKKPKFPAFHDDNIIDPELADYMSDDSSGDEQMGILGTMTDADLAPESFEKDKSNLSNSITTTTKRHRHRQGEKSISGINSRGAFDDINGLGSLISHRRPNRRRNVSNVSVTMQHLPSPRPKSAVFKGPSASSEMLFSMDHHGQGVPQITRSDSLREKPAAKVELNKSSVRHVHKLLHQLLDDAGIPDSLPWQKALVRILLQATDDVDPDISQGEDMDIRHYVKLKRIPGGRPGDTSYVSGVVFTKNLALKSMPRKITNPRIVLVTFPVEYQRHQQHFMSLQPVIEQEKEFLRVVVQRITNLRPHLLLAEKGVSGVALQYLSEANIAVAYNVKHTVLEAVARCAETEMITSLDMLALPVKVGRCSAFEVRTFVNNDYPGRKKSYIFLSGCRPDLGCTISLRGANNALLSKVKHIVEFMVYVVYNLKLESSLLRNESIEPPESGETSLSNSVHAVNESFRSASTAGVVDGNGPTVVINSASGESEPPSQATIDSLGSNGPDEVQTNGKKDEQGPNQTKSNTALETPAPEDPNSQVPDDVPMPTFYSDMVAKYETKILSASPYVKFTQPYLLMKAREQERRLSYLRRLLEHDAIEQREALEQKRLEEQKEEEERERKRQEEEEKKRRQQEEGDGEAKDGTNNTNTTEKAEPEVKEKAEPENLSTQRFQLIKPEMVEQIGQKAPRQMMEILHAVHDAEYDKALFNYRTQTRQWETYIQGNLDLFDPYSHQNIVVLYSVICTDTKIPCTEPGLVAIGFYDEQRYEDTEMDPDCTLGQYIEDLVYSKDDTCNSNGCERKMMEHHRTYVHDQSRITVFVENNSNAAPRGPELGDGITMWTYCKICKKDSEETPMSTSTFKYSFGKYMELLYWGRGLRMNDSVQCSHDHHRDHVRYFSLEDSRIRIHWDPIDLLEIVVPRARITWKVANDLKLKNEIYTKMEERWNKFMNSVNARLKGIRIDSVLPEKAESCKAELDRLTKKAQEARPTMIRQLQDIYVNSKYYEVVPFNKIVRKMLESATEWDTAFAKFEADFLGDKDMRQLTMMQLKKMFADNESKESLVSAGSTGDSEEPASQTFSEADEKSTQPTEFTENNSMEASATSAARMNDETQSTEEDGKLAIPAEGAIERVEPLDLAGSPVTVQSPEDLVQPAGNDAISKVPTSPAKTSSPQQPASPTEVHKGAPKQTEPGQSLTEKIDQKRREQAALSTQSVNPSSVIATPDEPKQTPGRRLARRSGTATSPPLVRAISQPARPMPRSQSASSRTNIIMEGKTVASEQTGEQQPPEASIKVDKKLSERLGLSALKTRGKGAQSSIPRPVKKRESKVSTLAKHFEQLSREFEKERIRDRKERAASLRQPRAMLPRTSTKAIVEVYDDVDEAFEEPAQPIEPNAEPEGENKRSEDATKPSESDPSRTENAQPQTEGESGSREEKDTSKTDTERQSSVQPSQATSDDEGGASDGEAAVSEEFLPDIKEIADSLEPSAEIPLELPKHQKTSLMKYLTKFWAERSASGWPALYYPVTGNDHIFVDSDIIVREDEPSSVIALALNSEDYKGKLAQIRSDAQAAARQTADSDIEPGSLPTSEATDLSMDETELEKSLLRVTGTHLKYQFKDGASVMTCKIFYAEQFDALRRKCGVAERIVESLSRCLKWDSKGGKTKSVFLKTLDDRLVLKSLSPIETSAFLRFAPGYFSIMAEALFHDLPSVIAKMVGFFQVLIKNPSTGVDVKLDLLVTENLFYDRSPTRIFDLKGSMRNRKIQSTGEQNEVLLDENMVEYIYESPLFAREHSKKLLRASVWNDTLFLARQNVMDYSLMIAVDESRKELVVGIIDCIRTYTWDKKLESWIKDRGFAGGGRNRPTVTSPKEYKNRFREAMARYILQSPNCWHLFNYPQYPHYHSRARFEEPE